MSSIYHLDNSVLLAIRYCAAGNQPRLKMTAFDEKNNTVKFEMNGITNLKKPDAPHVHALELKSSILII